MVDIVVTGYNCKQYVNDCLTSIIKQSVDKWRVFVCSDGSDDNTLRELKKFTDKRINIIEGKERKGAAYRRHELISKCEGIVCLLDLDDTLRSDALQLVLKEYDKGNICTYGNWIDQNGFIFPAKELYFTEEIKSNRDYRKDKWRFTHLKTFEKRLFDKINVSDFKYKGEWLQVTTESPMFAIYEMAGDKIGVIEEPIYTYKRNLKTSVSTQYSYAYIHSVYDEVCKIPKYPII